MPHDRDSFPVGIGIGVFIGNALLGPDSDHDLVLYMRHF
jgi:hypothetical protein